MTGNEIPRDRNGKPLDSGLIVMVIRGKEPPIFGNLAIIGKERSVVKSTEGGIHEISNCDIEITIEK